MLLLTLDEKKPRSRVRQITAQIRQKIEARTVRPGEQLPSTRRLAERLGLHRSTVAIAYQELWALGYLDLRPGVCPRVRARSALVTAKQPHGRGTIPWKDLASPANQTLLETYQEKARDGGLFS